MKNLTVKNGFNLNIYELLNNETVFQKFVNKIKEINDICYDKNYYIYLNNKVSYEEITDQIYNNDGDVIEHFLNHYLIKIETKKAVYKFTKKNKKGANWVFKVKEKFME